MTDVNVGLEGMVVAQQNFCFILVETGELVYYEDNRLIRPCGECVAPKA